jgi:lysophospholipase L1-like esterase
LIVAFGDSTTAPREGIHVFPQVMADGLTVAQYSVRVVNAGVPRDDSRLALQRLERDVLVHEPDLVTVFFGLNDSAVDVRLGASKPRVGLVEYEANLLQIIQIIRSRSAQIVLLTPAPVAWTPELKRIYYGPPYRLDDPDGWNVLLKDYAGVVRRIARVGRIPLVDVDHLFRDYAASPGHRLHDLMIDGMHPNDRGHEMIAFHVGDLVIRLLAEMDASRRIA